MPMWQVLPSMLCHEQHLQTGDRLYFLWRQLVVLLVCRPSVLSHYPSTWHCPRLVQTGQRKNNVRTGLCRRFRRSFLTVPASQALLYWHIVNQIQTLTVHRKLMRKWLRGEPQCRSWGDRALASSILNGILLTVGCRGVGGYGKQLPGLTSCRVLGLGNKRQQGPFLSS